MSTFKSRRQIIAEIKEKQLKSEEWQEKTEHYQQTAGQIRKTIVYIYQQIKARVGFLLVILQDNYKQINKLRKLFSNCYKFCFSLLAKLGKNICHYLGIIVKKLYCLLDSFLAPLWKIRWYILLLFFLCVLGLNVKTMLGRTSNNQLQNQLQQTNNYPLLPTSYFGAARFLFDFGYESLAWEYFNKGETLFKYYHVIHLDRLMMDDYKQSRQHLTSVQIKRQYLKQVNGILENKAPFSLELLLTKAKIEAELYNQERARQATLLAYWLNPQLEKVYKKILVN